MEFEIFKPKDEALTNEIFEFMDKHGLKKNLAGSKFWIDTLIYIVNVQGYKMPKLDYMAEQVAKYNQTTKMNVIRQLRYVSYSANLISPLNSTDVIMFAWYELKFKTEKNARLKVGKHAINKTYSNEF